MITDLELYIHAGIAEKGANEFMRALLKVCMDISESAGDSTTEEKRGILPMDDLHRVEPSAEEKAAAADTAQLKRDQEFADRLNIGVTSYADLIDFLRLRVGPSGNLKLLLAQRRDENMEPMAPAYGPGSITDASRYESYFRMDEVVTEARRQHDRSKEIQAAARFAAFLNAYPGHPTDAFGAYMNALGTSLTPEERETFDVEYNKEE